MDVGRVLSETAKRYPQKTAVIFKDEEITFSQLDLMATRLANKMRSCHVGRGDHVVIILPIRNQNILESGNSTRIKSLTTPGEKVLIWQ